MSRIDGENWLRLHLAARDTVRVRSLIKKYGTATELIESESLCTHVPPKCKSVSVKRWSCAEKKAGG